MAIRYLFKQLLLPPGVLLLALLVAWWLRKRFPRAAAACFGLALGGLWLMSLPVVVEWSARLLESEPALAEARWVDLAQQVEAIVVLGAGRERGDPAWGGRSAQFAGLAAPALCRPPGQGLGRAAGAQRWPALWPAAQRGRPDGRGAGA
jgi:uncharacterized SAM-binding protein YcdF (DUF218 family)